MQHINAGGLALLESSEELRLTAYKDVGGVWTIGWGSTKAVHEGMVITRKEAEQRLYSDLSDAEQAVCHNVRVPLNDYQFSALVLFVFNVGETQFRKSTLLKKLNVCLYNDVASELSKWVYIKGVRSTGLINRRKAESDLFYRVT